MAPTPAMTLAAHVAAFVAGAAIVVMTATNVVRTLVLPRAAPSVIVRLEFVGLRWLFGLRARPSRTYEQRDAVLQYYAPVALLALPLVWMGLSVAGFTAMLWGAGVDPVREAFVTSGSSILTLGFARPEGMVPTVLTFAEAGLGLGVVGLLISYLPSIYGAFGRREREVALLEGLAGSPPSAPVLLVRQHRIGGLDRMDPLWQRWQLWFADVEESHTSIAALCFFRSPRADHSWITAAGCVLDAAALRLSALDIPGPPAHAALCIRSGFLALRHIADFFSIPYDADPAPTAPVSIDRDEFDEALASLRAAGLPVRADSDAAWRDYAGWRVNYDTVLLRLAALVAAPVAPWSSDRAPGYTRPPLPRRKRP